MTWNERYPTYCSMIETLCCQDLLLQGFHFHKGPLVLLLLSKPCVLLPEILF